MATLLNFPRRRRLKTEMELLVEPWPPLWEAAGKVGAVLIVATIIAVPVAIGVAIGMAAS